MTTFGSKYIPAIAETFKKKGEVLRSAMAAHSLLKNLKSKLEKKEDSMHHCICAAFGQRTEPERAEFAEFLLEELSTPRFDTICSRLAAKAPEKLGEYVPELGLDDDNEALDTSISYVIGILHCLKATERTSKIALNLSKAFVGVDDNGYTAKDTTDEYHQAAKLFFTQKMCEHLEY